MTLTFEDKLRNYTDVIVRVGVGLQPGQRLVVQAPVETAPVVRRIVASAYQAGAPYVDVLWNDEELARVRLEHAPRDSFEEYPGWRPRMLVEAAERGDAFLTVHAADPDLLRGQDPELIATVQRVQGQHLKPFRDLLSSNTFNWCLVSVPISAWAAKVFPDLPAEVRNERLWDAIFTTVRADQPDPVAAWEQHIAMLITVRDRLNDKRYAALRYRGPGTDLRVGLPAEHAWLAARLTSKRGIAYTPNLPTEEVFTLPHSEQVDGQVSSTKPLHYAGTLIQDFGFRFEGGTVTEVWAGEGEATLRKLLETDDGARRLGEVALVPTSSPVNQTGLLFYNTLFDENAASHLALGSAYRSSLRGGRL
jgi:aminopeptidase